MRNRGLIWWSTAIFIQLGGIASLCAESLSRQQVEDAVKEALSRGSVDKAYLLMLPLAKAGDAEVQFSCAFMLLNGWLTTLPEQEQKVQGMKWLRKAGHQGLEQALARLADTYRWGWSGMRPDQELAACYRSAASKVRENSMSKVTEIARCAELERTKGYIDRP